MLEYNDFFRQSEFNIFCYERRMVWWEKISKDFTSRLNTVMIRRACFESV